MSRPDEGMIHQWLDGECTPEESAEIERLIATDAAWAAAVAEARGLIAASSRIVDALDAVPRAMPAGSRAAPVVVKRSVRAFRVKPWMGLAAGLVLVAGTAYVLRERATEPFVPTATVDTEPAVPPVAPSVALPAAPPPPTSGDASIASKSADSEQRDVTRSAPERVPERVPERAPEPVPERARNADVATPTRSRAAAEAPRGVVLRGPQQAPTAAVSETALPTLEGCWRVTAPPELLGVLHTPVIRRQAGDTLVLVTARGDVTVVRADDELRGGLQAKREACGAMY